MMPRKVDSRSLLVVDDSDLLSGDALVVRGPDVVQDPALVYMASLSTDKSRATARESLQRIAKMVRVDDWRSIPWGRLTAKETALIRASLMKAYGPTTVRLTLSVLRGVLKSAFRLRQMDAESFARASDWRPIKASRIAKGRKLEETEIAELLRAIEAIPGLYGVASTAMAAVLLVGGLRREEVSTLTVDAFDGTSVRVTGKGLRQRDQPLVPWAREALKRWLKARNELHLTTDRLFCRLDRRGRVYDQPVSPWMVWNWVVTVTEDAGIDDISTHDFRRTFASNMWDATDAATVQRLMGHANLSTTVLYDRRGQQQAEKAVQALQKWAKR